MILEFYDFPTIASPFFEAIAVENWWFIPFFNSYFWLYLWPSFLSKLKTYFLFVVLYGIVASLFLFGELFFVELFIFLFYLLYVSTFYIFKLTCSWIISLGFDRYALSSSACCYIYEFDIFCPNFVELKNSFLFMDELFVGFRWFNSSLIFTFFYMFILASESLELDIWSSVMLPRRLFGMNLWSMDLWCALCNPCNRSIFDSFDDRRFSTSFWFSWSLFSSWCCSDPFEAYLFIFYLSSFNWWS